MKTQKLSVLIRLLAALAVSLVFIACPAEPEDPPDTRHAPYGVPPYTGPASGSAVSSTNPLDGELIEGHSASITINLTLENGYITYVTFTHNGHSATPGQSVINKARTDIVAKNEIKIDVVSKASATPKLINRAGQEALATIPGYIPD